MQPKTEAELIDAIILIINGAGLRFIRRMPESAVDGWRFEVLDIDGGGSVWLLDVTREAVYFDVWERTLRNGIAGILDASVRPEIVSR